MDRWQQVDKLLEEALEQQPDHRAAFLDEACNGDAALRQEVESLLSAHGKAGDFIEAPVLEVAAAAHREAVVRIVGGQQLGPYKILSLLGAGGMGEVYRAKDGRIGREVAIKVLPPAFSADADRLRRFEQEARAAGRLNHPNILALHDVGTHEGSPYIVSELLQGETLRDRLRGKALPLRKAIDLALQMARGLAAAHENGIVHRDLKPENLFIITDGHLKILDFGLAKLQPKRARVTDANVSTQPLSINTEPSLVLGTVGYMAPEQVRGEPTDHRSDIFAFGAILYEMLAGQRAFQAKSSVETMHAILTEEPPELSKANHQIPRALEHIVRHCLEKVPDQRFQSASDLAFDLEELIGSADSTSESHTSLPERLKRQRFVWILSGLCLLAVLSASFAAYTYLRQSRVNPQSLRFTVSPPEKAVFEESLALSPDGRWLAFLASMDEGKRSLWIRPLDSLAARALPGTDGATYPFWSPDSRALGFFAQKKLKKIEVSGGPPQVLSDAPFPLGGTWNRDGVIVFGPNYRDPLYRVPAAGGERTPVTTVDTAAHETHLWPHFLPDGRHFLYMGWNTPGTRRGTSAIHVGAIDGKDEKSLLGIAASSSVAYAPSGYLLFERDQTLFAQPFDAEHLQVSGEAVAVAEGVTKSGFSYASFSVTETSLAYWGGVAMSNSQLIWFNREGKSLGGGGRTSYYTDPWLSPDVNRAVVRVSDPDGQTGDLWLLQLLPGTPLRLTFHPKDDRFPIWSPDGNRIVFSSNRTGYYELYQRLSSGAGDDELLLETRTSKIPTDWGQDGRHIVYLDILPTTQFDLSVLPLYGNRNPQPFAQREFNEKQGRLSPDGKWMAYASDETGRYEVYVQPFPGGGGKSQISSGGGEQPSWRSDGKELFYVGEGQKLIAVGVDSRSSTFRANTPRELFRMHSPISRTYTRNEYASTPDGQRFLVNTLVGTPASSPITVVINWTVGLKR